MRGDRPEYILYWIFEDEFTPHARGSTLSHVTFACDFRVYPACAGIDLSKLQVSTTTPSLPRMRGDRPRGDLEVEVI